MRRKVLSQAAYGLAFLFCAASSAFGGSFAVSPVRATLSDSKRVVSLTVRNSGAQPAVIQLETVSWSQEGGKDLYSPTREILATPPIFTVPPGGSQVIRVGLRRSIDPQRELAYRLFLQEVPPPAKPGFQGLNVALRIGVPVFIQPETTAAPRLEWRAYRTKTGQLILSLANTGNAHVQVATFSITEGEERNLGKYQISTYLLPGQRREWLIKDKQSEATKLKVFAQTDAGEFRADIAVERR